MKIVKSKSFPRPNVQELIIVLIALGIVVFVLYAIYKNVSQLRGIRSLSGFVPQKPWEGFVNEGFTGSAKHSLEYSSYPTNEAIDSKKTMLIDTSSSSTSTKPQCGKVWGLNGLFCTPDVADKLIDVFYSAKSDMNCAGTGLTKGQGNLCLDKVQQSLLSSRGGNADTLDYFKS